jgi:hypothetical protein
LIVRRHALSVGCNAGQSSRDEEDEMTWKPLGKLMLCCVLLGGCDATGNSVNKAGHGLNTSYNNMRQRLSGYIYQPKPEQSPLFVAHTSDFCYQVLMDIICYDKPQPQLHMNLVGVQGDGVTSYAYDDFLPEHLRGGGSVGMQSGNVGASGSNLDMTSGGETIHVSDLDGTSFKDGTQTPFYHSPSPVVGDPYQKPIEPMTEQDYHNRERSKSVPQKLMGM